MASKKKAEDTETAAQEVKAFAKSLLKVPARAQHRLGVTRACGQLQLASHPSATTD